jgi:hypothetical protein
MHSGPEDHQYLEKTLSIVATTSGAVEIGAFSVLIISSTTFAGTVNGIPFAADRELGFEAHPGYRLESIPYTITAGSLEIHVQRVD